uniref:Polysaccharide biosynthesis C-terminal domain-containing protein n=1 Tax=Roseihalotalea indica TaxID=2867963 RepID=A0AA49GQP4_9BACT|nr:polysaccharide biosynthesis C-terminal domain-containing protein [Tunicatimonas sp. TK19036]
MNPLKKLAGQTALYGVSTILGRVLTYALVPLHTFIFEEESYGVITELYAYVAFFNILYTFGMETAYFRFTARVQGDKKEKQQVYWAVCTTVFLISTVSSLILLFYADNIATSLGYADLGYVIRWIAIILWIDAVVAVPYARLRQENRPLQFTVTKLAAIFLQVALNMFFLLLLPKIHTATTWLDALYNLDLGVGYVFLANLIGNAIIPFMLWKYILQIRFRLDAAVLRPMLIYAFPIFIMGIGGMINENIEKILLNDLLPADFYPDKTPQQALGTYGACFKLSIFMTLAIQAFRYAGEPFFFSRAEDEDKQAPRLFAQVMHYFTIFSILILLGVSVNIDLLGQLLIRDSDYWDALYIVPFLLFAKLLYGVYINLSIWFKLTDKTYFGTITSIIGAVVTLAGNFLLIPVLGYLGSAVASIACFSVMCLVCYYYGKKYYPIPYNFTPSFWYLLTALLIIYGTFKLELSDTLVKNIVNIGITLVFATVVFLIERSQLQQQRKNVHN